MIEPEFIVNTGDIINTNDNGNILTDNLGQDDLEWSIYRNATDSAARTSPGTSTSPGITISIATRV